MNIITDPQEEKNYHIFKRINKQHHNIIIIPLTLNL